MGLPREGYRCKSCGRGWTSGPVERCPWCSEYQNDNPARTVSDAGSSQVKTHATNTKAPTLKPKASDIRGRRNVEEMDQTTPANRKLYYVLKMARWGARSLPGDPDFHFLVYSYFAEQRGDGVAAEGFQSGWESRKVEVQSRAERKARELRLDVQKFDDVINTENIAFVMQENPAMRLFEACEKLIDSATSAGVHLATKEELSAAEAELITDIVAWLRRRELPFSIRPAITIPATKLQAIMEPIARGLPDIYLGAAIPREKLLNAEQVTGLPFDESVSALIDCTFFGSARDCVLFGSRAVYFRNHGVDNFLPYSEFPDITFYLKEDGVGCGDINVMSLAGSGFPPFMLANVLDAIKRETIKREFSATSENDEGLDGLPGMNDLKQMLLEEVVQPLRNPEEFRKYKIDIPNGILMYGPPGCGKTFIAQKLAGELSYNFYEISPAVVGSMYIHGSVLKIRQMFEEAAAHAPALMFVDEFEGMVPSRRELAGTEQYKSEEVNEWLMQIANCANRRVLFVAATNEPWRIDGAVQRSGRLDKKVYVGPPDEGAIGEMLLYHLKGRPHSPSDSILEFATAIAGQGYSASDLKLIVDEAAKFAMRDRSEITPKCLTRAAAERVRPSITLETETMYQQLSASQ